jgi:cytochrome b
MSIPPPIDIPQQLALATKAWGKMRRLASYAAFDGWTLAVLGALSLICGGYGSASALLISFVLIGAGVFEIISVRRLRQLQPTAIPHLAYNQFGLAAALIIYSLFSLIQAHLHGGNSGVSSEVEQALSDAGGSTSDARAQVTSLMDIFYSCLIAFALVWQGGTGLYYLSRRKALQEYLDQTPDWIQQMQRERGEIKL